MSGRNVFSESEKTCLMELIIKYKLQKPSTLTAASQSAKKVLWQRLTQEFNAIEGNSKRNEVQLKKCWDNLKTRQKSILTEEKRERMRTGGGQYRPTEPQPGTSGETLVAEALYDQTDVAIEGVFDSDTIYDSEDAVAVEMVTAESQYLDISPHPPRSDTPPPPPHLPRRDTAPHPSRRDTPPPPSRRDTPQHRPRRDISPHPASPPRRPLSQRTDFGAAPLRGLRNVRSRVIEEEFTVRQESYKKKEKREEELFQYQKKERVFMMMAAEQSYLTAKAGKEAAEELVRCNKAKRVLAEYEFKIKKNNV